jgi:hypothetical protein
MNLNQPSHEETYCEPYYLHAGRRKVWPISAHPTADDSKTLTIHLRAHIPGAVFLGYRFGDPSLWISQPPADRTKNDDPNPRRNRC